jgi:hypothetical protein
MNGPPVDVAKQLLLPRKRPTKMSTSGDTLAVNRSLKDLYIDGDPITTEGWRGFSTFLTSNSTLEALDIEYTGIEVEGTVAISPHWPRLNILP